MMMNMPSTEHAVQLAKEHPNLGVGVHLVLTSKKPLRNDVSSLVNENGEFKNKKQIFEYIDIDRKHIEAEWEAQIEKFLSYGLQPTHFDSHHFVHSHPNISPVIFQLAEKYNVPVRNNFGIEKPPHIITTELFISKFFGDNVELDTILEIEKYKDNTVELMCHPGYVDHELLMNSTYHLKRTNELEILTSTTIKNWIKRNNIRLINYRDI